MWGVGELKDPRGASISANRLDNECIYALSETFNNCRYFLSVTVSAVALHRPSPMAAYRPAAASTALGRVGPAPMREPPVPAPPSATCAEHEQNTSRPVTRVKRSIHTCIHTGSILSRELTLAAPSHGERTRRGRVRCALRPSQLGPSQLGEESLDAAFDVAVEGEGHRPKDSW